MFELVPFVVLFGRTWGRRAPKSHTLLGSLKGNHKNANQILAPSLCYVCSGATSFRGCVQVTPNHNHAFGEVQHLLMANVDQVALDKLMFERSPTWLLWTFQIQNHRCPLELFLLQRDGNDRISDTQRAASFLLLLHVIGRIARSPSSATFYPFLALWVPLLKSTRKKWVPTYSNLPTGGPRNY